MEVPYIDKWLYLTFLVFLVNRKGILTSMDKLMLKQGKGKKSLLTKDSLEIKQLGFCIKSVSQPTCEQMNSSANRISVPLGRRGFLIPVQEAY